MDGSINGCNVSGSFIQLLSGGPGLVVLQTIRAEERVRGGATPVRGGEHTEVGRAISPLVQVVGLARDLAEVTCSMVKLVVFLGGFQDPPSLCV